MLASTHWPLKSEAAAANRRSKSSGLPSWFHSTRSRDRPACRLSSFGPYSWSLRAASPDVSPASLAASRAATSAGGTDQYCAITPWPSLMVNPRADHGPAGQRRPGPRAPVTTPWPAARCANDLRRAADLTSEARHACAGHRTRRDRESSSAAEVSRRPLRGLRAGGSLAAPAFLCPAVRGNRDPAVAVGDDQAVMATPVLSTSADPAADAMAPPARLRPG